jgi:chorismate synthase
MLRFLTAGESHGKSLIAILEGIPSGVSLSLEDINRELKRRQTGFGRGDRMKIEEDTCEILSGVRFSKTLGTPIAILIKNRDFENWKEIMKVEGEEPEDIFKITSPRPGHADLPGILKYNFEDIRCVIERASARETAARVAVGAVCKRLLKEFGIKVGSFVVKIGKVACEIKEKNYEKIFEIAEKSPLRCPDKKAESEMIKAIERAKEKGDTLGGIFEVFATGVPPGLGSYIQWDRRIDAKISYAMMSIPAVKGVEIGLGFKQGELLGSQVHDEIFYSEKKGFYRKTNNAGGIEGGITNGEEISIRCVMKPISTLGIPLNSVDVFTKKKTKAVKERADVCAVPSAGVIAESMLSFVLAEEMCIKFAGDSLSEMKRNFNSYLDYLKNIYGKKRFREKR